MREIKITKNGDNIIGHAGEHEACTAIFDVSGWKEMYGDGTFTIINKRPTDAYSYPIECIYDQSNETVRWVVKDADVSIAGTGKVQIIYSVNDKIAKTDVFETVVLSSLGQTGDVPSPFKAWFEKIIGLLGVGMTAHATTLPAGAEATASYDDSTRVLSLGIPKGKDGKDGKDYVITPADYEAIAEKTAELVPPYDDTEIREEIGEVKQDLTDLSALVDGKMEFYKVTLDGSPMKFYHDGVVLNYADLEAKYNDDKYFLYCEYESVTFIPSLPPVEDPVHPEKVLEFVATWKYSGAMHITSIKINELEQIKVEEFEAVGDVKINGTSIVTDGVAEIPYASQAKGGVVRTTSQYGVAITSDGYIYPLSYTNEQYKGMVNNIMISKGTLENIWSARHVTLTQAEYDAISVKDPMTEYNIVEE